MQSRQINNQKRFQEELNEMLIFQNGFLFNSSGNAFQEFFNFFHVRLFPVHVFAEPDSFKKKRPERQQNYQWRNPRN